MNALAAAEAIRAGNNERNGACKTTSMMEDPQTPGSDCNSNPANDTQDLVGSEFIQDNLDYQWFIDYKDGGLHVHPSVLSSLSTSYTKDDLGYYDDLARNIDANLAEVDMESFRTADIHTLLTALPVMCTDPVQHSEGEDSACSTTNSISICKSSLLFSPVKEMPVLPPGGSYSVDSLDCEDMLITCQTNNKNNYTIAFEGSIAMYSDGSQDFDNNESKQQKVYDEATDSFYDRALNLRNMLDLSMACSDSKIYTTWSNLKNSTHMGKAMSRHPSGNNNTNPDFLQQSTTGVISNATTDHSSNQQQQRRGSRCHSLPDLTRAAEQLQRVDEPLNFSVDSGDGSSRSGRMQSNSDSPMSRSTTEESSDSVGNTISSTSRKLQNMSLVRLFMKQKSMSTEGMSLTLDSGSEGGWPNSNSESASNPTTQVTCCRQTSTGGQQTDNDLAIKWLKTADSDMLLQLPKGPSTNCSTSVEDLLNTSRSLSSIDRDNSTGMRRLIEPSSKTNAGVQAMTEVEDNGVQTSLAYPSFNTCSREQHQQSNFPIRETLMNEKPVYVVYPNYTLPDLSFLKSAEAARFDNVALKPHSFGRRGNAAFGAKLAGRPFSCNDVDALKQRGFSHVCDWESLTFLLPTEYRKVLHDVPEVARHAKLIGEQRKPLFCLSPPMRQRRLRAQHNHHGLVDMQLTNTVLSSSSSTTTQPSSGYRGSSTILSDSSSNQQNSGNSTLGNNPLYLYRYDSVSSEASLHGQEKLHSARQYAKQQQQRSPVAPNLPKRSISLPQTNEAPSVPPRPPLPRGILRKNRVAANQQQQAKRCSMFEMGQLDEVDGTKNNQGRKITQENKRMSLQEPYYMNNDLQLLRCAGIVDSEKDIDETEERQRYEKVRHFDNEDLESSTDDVKQLEEFLRRSGFSSNSSDNDGEHDSDLKLRSCVRRFLALKMNQDMAKLIDMADSQKKTVSFAMNGKPRYVDDKANILGEKERLNVSEAVDLNMEMRPLDMEEKKKLIWSVNRAVDGLLKFWHSEPVRSRQGYNDKNECSQLCLSQLCPALYAVMSDGLKPQLNSTFGPIGNSVWQVVEASSQQGPLTKTLNDLVQKINGEDFMTEGMLKFHAFVFGLLNLRALDAWFAYLCTRESILRKHYSNNSLFIGALGCANSREVVDAFLNILQPLAFCPFQLDLLYQYRQLHNSFGKGNALNLDTKKPKTKSCSRYERDHEGDVNKLWNQKPFSGELHVLPRLDDSDDYTDSLEHSPLNRASPRRAIRLQSKLVDTRDSKIRKDDKYNVEPASEIKFRRLQDKWEQLGRDDMHPGTQHPRDSTQPPTPNTTPSPSSPTRTMAPPPCMTSKSRIPRPLTSPTKAPSNLPVPVKTLKSPSGIPKKPIGSTAAAPGQLSKRPAEQKSCLESPRRASRLDQDGVPRPHMTRPSSLPYGKSYSVGTKDRGALSPHRRAASTSLPRPHSIAGPPSRLPNKPPPKSVRTLTSKPQSEDGHLSFGEGEKLKVILEVDGKWLLCSRGERKGLVPRNCVRPIQT